jgi:type II secretory pathway component PulJ
MQREGKTKLKGISADVYRWKTGEYGMTMVELLATMFVLLMVIYALCNLYGFAYRDWTDGMAAEQLQRQTQDAMGFMEMDVKQSLYNFNNTTYQQPIATYIDSDGAEEVVINEDVNNDNQLDQVHFRLQNMVLQRVIVQPNTDGSYNDPATWVTSWTTILAGITSAPATLFTMTSNGGYHYSLSIATLTVQSPIRKSVSIQFGGGLGVRGNTYLQQQLTTATL